MDDNNNVVVVEDKIYTEPRTEQAKQIFSHPGGKARSEGMENSLILQKETWPSIKGQSGHDESCMSTVQKIRP